MTLLCTDVNVRSLSSFVFVNIVFCHRGKWEKDGFEVGFPMIYSQVSNPEIDQGGTLTVDHLI